MMHRSMRRRIAVAVDLVDQRQHVHITGRREAAAIRHCLDPHKGRDGRAVHRLFDHER